MKLTMPTRAERWFIVALVVFFGVVFVVTPSGQRGSWKVTILLVLVWMFWNWNRPDHPPVVERNQIRRLGLFTPIAAYGRAIATTAAVLGCGLFVTGVLGAIASGRGNYSDVRKEWLAGAGAALMMGGFLYLRRQPMTGRS